MLILRAEWFHSKGGGLRGDPYIVKLLVLNLGSERILSEAELAPRHQTTTSAMRKMPQAMPFQKKRRSKEISDCGTKPYMISEVLHIAGKPHICLKLPRAPPL